MTNKELTTADIIKELGFKQSVSILVDSGQFSFLNAFVAISDILEQEEAKNDK